MNYFEILGEPDAVMWEKSDGNSGVVREGDADWDVYLRWLAAGNELASFEPVDTRLLEQLRADALGLISMAAEQALGPVIRVYPQAEMDSWPEQYKEAEAWLSDATVSAPLIDAICGPLRVQKKRDYCESILAKAKAYKAALGAVIAWRRTMTAWVEAQDERTTLISFAPRYPEVPNAS